MCKKHVFERFGAPQALKIFACGAKTVDSGVISTVKIARRRRKFFGVFWGFKNGLVNKNAPPFQSRIEERGGPFLTSIDLISTIIWMSESGRDCYHLLRKLTEEIENLKNERYTHEKFLICCSYILYASIKPNFIQLYHCFGFLDKFKYLMHARHTC